ncbi:MAG TPA: hypothetical protein VEM96_09600 [Pyrinomonadaceae bacterium]|nr:hypothetical protein [Pyrinomonadaceae bacterium]
MKMKVFLVFVSAVLFAGIAQSQIQKPKTEPSVLVKGPIGIITRCVVNGGDIYWLEENGQNILYTGKTGRYPAPLVRTNIKIELFIVDSTGVYYLSQNKYEWGETEKSFSMKGELRTTGKKRSITTLLPNIGIPASTFLTADATDVYVLALTEEQGGAIIKVPKTGGEPKYVASHILSAVSGAVDEKNIYLVDVAYNSVPQVAKGGGELTILFKPEGSSFEPLRIATADEHLYLATRSNDIYQISKADGRARLLYQGKGLVFYGPSLVVDRENLYWQEDNRIMRMSRKGGEATALVRDASPTCIGLDDKYVYWFEAQKGLLKAEK